MRTSRRAKSKPWNNVSCQSSLNATLSYRMFNFLFIKKKKRETFALYEKWLNNLILKDQVYIPGQSEIATFVPIFDSDRRYIFCFHFSFLFTSDQNPGIRVRIIDFLESNADVPMNGLQPYRKSEFERPTGKRICLNRRN